MSRHVVYNTDNAGLPGVDDDSVHLTVTSPPYVTTEFFEGQEFDYDGFVAEFGRLCNDLYRVTVAGGRFALNVADIITKYRYDDDPRITRVPLGSDLLQAAMRSGFRLLERYIWDKGYTRNFGGPLLGSYPYPPTIFNNETVASLQSILPGSGLVWPITPVRVTHGGCRHGRARKVRCGCD